MRVSRTEGSPWAVLGVAVLGLVLTAATSLAILAAEQRRVERQLDLHGQALVEELHDALHQIRHDLTTLATLLALDPPTDRRDFVTRAAATMELAEGVAHIEVTKTPTGPGYEIRHVWTRDADPPPLLSLGHLRSTLAMASITGRAEPAPAEASMPPKLLLVRVVSLPQGREDLGFVVAIVDPIKLASGTRAVSGEDAPAWGMVELAGVEAVVPSSNFVHREYLIVGQRAWQVELTPAVGTTSQIHWEHGAYAAAAGVAATIVVAWLARLALRRRQLSRQLEASAAAAREKDRFLLRLSHEIRTPLTAVVGFLQILRQGQDMGEEERRELIEAATLEAEEMASIVQDILVATRDELDSLVMAVEPTNLIREAAAVAANHAGSMRVEVYPDPEHGPVALADPLRVRQIIRNLVTNAVRYGGSRLMLSGHRLGAHAFLVIADDGEGLSDAQAERLADPHSPPRPDPGNRESLGLGLKVAQLLARRMGGAIVYRRTANGLSSFELSLPVWEGGDAGSTPARIEQAVG